jgi:hypothetical protein
MAPANQWTLYGHGRPPDLGLSEPAGARRGTRQKIAINLPAS